MEAQRPSWTCQPLQMWHGEKLRHTTDSWNHRSSYTVLVKLSQWPPPFGASRHHGTDELSVPSPIKLLTHEILGVINVLFVQKKVTTRTLPQPNSPLRVDGGLNGRKSNMYLNYPAPFQCKNRSFLGLQVITYLHCLCVSCLICFYFIYISTEKAKVWYKDRCGRKTPWFTTQKRWEMLVNQNSVGVTFAGLPKAVSV